MLVSFSRLMAFQKGLTGSAKVPKWKIELGTPFSCSISFCYLAYLLSMFLSYICPVYSDVLLAHFDYRMLYACDLICLQENFSCLKNFRQWLCQCVWYKRVSTLGQWPWRQRPMWSQVKHIPVDFSSKKPQDKFSYPFCELGPSWAPREKCYVLKGGVTVETTQDRP